jgi:hypothetical protein
MRIVKRNKKWRNEKHKTNPSANGDVLTGYQLAARWHSRGRFDFAMRVDRAAAKTQALALLLICLCRMDFSQAKLWNALCSLDGA